MCFLVPLLANGAGCAYLVAGRDVGGIDPGPERGPGKYLSAHQKKVSCWEERVGPQELFTLSPSTLGEGCCRHKCIAVMCGGIRDTPMWGFWGFGAFLG